MFDCTTAPCNASRRRSGSNHMRSIIALWLSTALAACGSAPEATVDTGKKVAPELAAPSGDAERMWVSTQRVDRRTCPSITCGSVGWIAFRQAVEPLERHDGWVRITKRYDGSCRNGVSEYVDKGDKSCSAKNGILDGRFAEWVPESALTAKQPPDPAASATADESIVAQSDNFSQHHKIFAQVAQHLIAEGRCTAGDFQEMGGWLKSVNEHKNEPVYFTYCGGMTSANRVYMNASTGEVL